MLLTRLRDQFPERDEKPTPAAHVEDVVILVPGFLGFDHFGGFFYFADRVCGALRGALEVKLGRPGRLPAITTSVSRSASGGSGGGDGARAPSPSAPPPADS
ncbi:hypothetical protein ACMHYB_06370 [Sorangium sp. So ce1128]